MIQYFIIFLFVMILFQMSTIKIILKKPTIFSFHLESIAWLVRCLHMTSMVNGEHNNSTMSTSGNRYRTSPFVLQFYKVNYIFCDGQSRFIKIYFGQHPYSLIQLSIRLFLIVPMGTKLIYYIWHIKLIIYTI
jgi:hypothetical protein